MATLQAIKYNDGNLEILDQLLLPESCTYISINNVQDAWSAIREMKVTIFLCTFSFFNCLSLILVCE
jgi:methylthioribose-1-phosphate isomerase